MMASYLLDERQIWFLDNLITFMIESYDLTRFVDYTGFKNKVEEW